jgi:hypothetical protein
MGVVYNMRILSSSIWRQGIRSNYRGSYWKFLYRTLVSFGRSPAKLSLGLSLLLSAEHFVVYTKVVIDHLQAEAEHSERSARSTAKATTNEFVGVQAVS